MSEVIQLGSHVFRKMPPARLSDRDGLTIPTPPTEQPAELTARRMQMLVGNCLATGVISMFDPDDSVGRGTMDGGLGTALLLAGCLFIGFLVGLCF